MMSNGSRRRFAISWLRHIPADQLAQPCLQRRSTLRPRSESWPVLETRASSRKKSSHLKKRDYWSLSDLGALGGQTAGRSTSGYPRRRGPASCARIGSSGKRALRGPDRPLPHREGERVADLDSWRWGARCGYRFETVLWRRWNCDGNDRRDLRRHEPIGKSDSVHDRRAPSFGRSADALEVVSLSVKYPMSPSRAQNINTERSLQEKSVVAESALCSHHSPALVIPP